MMFEADFCERPTLITEGVDHSVGVFTVLRGYASTTILRHQLIDDVERKGHLKPLWRIALERFTATTGDVTPLTLWAAMWPSLSPL